MHGLGVAEQLCEVLEAASLHSDGEHRGVRCCTTTATRSPLCSRYVSCCWSCHCAHTAVQALGAVIALSQEEKFREDFMAAEGVQRLLGTLSFHKWQPTVVEWCCQSLAQVSASPPCQALLLELGAVTMVIEAIQYFNKTSSLEHMSVQAWSLAALRCLALNNPKVKMALQQAGFLRILHELMALCRQHPSIQASHSRYSHHTFTPYEHVNNAWLCADHVHGRRSKLAVFCWHSCQILWRCG